MRSKTAFGVLAATASVAAVGWHVYERDSETLRAEQKMGREDHVAAVARLSDFEHPIIIEEQATNDQGVISAHMIHSELGRFCFVLYKEHPINPGATTNIDFSRCN